MNLKKFTIISSRDVQALDETDETILLNLDHIVSIKPISIVVEGDVKRGFWVRMSNGKKYRALEVPSEIYDLAK